MICETLYFSQSNVAYLYNDGQIRMISNQIDTTKKKVALIDNVYVIGPLLSIDLCLCFQWVVEGSFRELALSIALAYS